ncbi:MAG TPA: hypothetical protein VL524_12280, partial [Gemmatimonadaceae bacterium]|nr:hypothetical protein [Gemmatimonadaceae bacterium]
RGAASVRSFVDKSSAELIPYFIDVPAKHSFGVSFSRAWHDFSDSIARSVANLPSQPIAGWRQLTSDGVFVFAPRWLSDSSIVYSGAPGRQTFGAYRVTLAGKRTRIGRRNSQSANVPIAGGGLLYAQTDYVNPYQVRSDLWVQRRGRERQLTFGQRLTSPDARADGAIVAAQIVPGATRLVRVSSDGKRITPLTLGSYDEQWTEPRWSHAGDRVVASRWLHGNVSQIVVIDTLGRIVHTVSSGHSVEATPSWLPNDAGILYSSDRDGSAQVYAELFGDAPNYAGAVTYRLSNAATGLFEPTEAPVGNRTAAVVFRADGYHLGVAPCCTPVGAERVVAYYDVTQASSAAPVLVDSGPVHRYSAWRTFYPRYWLPTVDQGIEGGYRIGLMTSGYDVVGRHAINATLEAPTNNTGVVGDLSYQYSGLGLPIIQLDAAQEWESLGSAYSRDPQRQIIGSVRRRTWSGDALATWLRRRSRTSLSLTGGAGIEHRSHATTANVPLSSLDTTGLLGTPTFPSLIAGAGFANYQRPPFSISPEDGVQLNTTIRERLRSGVAARGPASLSAVASASAYKSLDLPGFAHHVIALRGAAGYADDRASGYFTVGGVSGSTFQIIPGYVIGEGRKTFPVRGFEDGSLVGTRALVGSAEYRIPLLLTGRAPGTLPFFLDRSSLSLFTDYGTAWCPNIRMGREVCNTGDSTLTTKLDIASVGAELNLNLGVLSWDSPYRFRLGFAVPTYNRALFGRPSVQAYVVSGISF